MGPYWRASVEMRAGWKRFGRWMGGGARPASRRQWRGYCLKKSSKGHERPSRERAVSGMHRVGFYPAGASPIHAG